MTEFLPNDAAAGDEEQFLVLTLRYLDGVADAEEEAALARRIRSSPQCRGWFVALCGQLGMMHEMFAPGAEEETDSEVAAFADAAVQPFAGSDADPLGAEVPSPRIVIHASSPLPPSLFSIHSPLGGWLISYGVATLLAGAAILGGWLYKVSLSGGTDLPSEHVARTDPPPAPPVTPAPESVGRITGLVDCQWSGPAAQTGASVHLGGRYTLHSGLVEIAYETGANVILQGPCVYEVDSHAGGFLSLGKLTARVEKSEVRGQGSEGRGQGAEPSPLFTVRTPTALVTDLGTEFGVLVDEAGATQSHVFRGKVEVRTLDGAAGRPGEVIRLGENEAARTERGKDAAVRVAKLDRGESPRHAFVRQMPDRLRITLFNTGIGIAEGDPDPHWQLVARSDDPHFTPRAATVTCIGDGAFGSWLANDPGRSRWLSTANGPPFLPDAVTYTFRTTFEFAGEPPETFVLRGRFIGDNHVDAIRLNGKPVRVPEHDDSTFDRFTAFSIEKGFVEGTNTLEFDVRNGTASDDRTGTGPMGLRVEWDGRTPL